MPNAVPKPQRFPGHLFFSRLPFTLAVCTTIFSLTACGGGPFNTAQPTAPTSAAQETPALVDAYSVSVGSGTGTPPAAAKSPLKYFGYALVDCGWDDPLDATTKTNYVTEVAAFTNTGQMCVFDPASSIVSRMQLMTQNKMQAMLHVQSIFFSATPDAALGSGTRIELRPDFQSRWNNFVSLNKLSENISAVSAFYVVDEPVWNGLSANDLKRASDAIKATFPSVPTALIEAAPGIAGLQVPASIDWIGFDHYGIPNPQTDPTFMNEMVQLKAKRSRADQKIIVVMDAQSLPFYAASGYPDSYMAQVATSYYNLSKSDPDVIAIFGYLWPGGLDDPKQKGVRDLPQNVLDEHKRIGKLISGK